MEPQTKRTLMATVLCVVVLIGWMRFMAYMYPPQERRPTTAPADGLVASRPTETGAPIDRPAGQPAEFAGRSEPSVGTAGHDGAGWQVVGGSSTQSHRIGAGRSGADNPYEFEVDLTSLGASAENLRLSRHRNAVPKDKKNPGHDPYDLLRPVEDSASGERYSSFEIRQIRIDGDVISLRGLDWRLADSGADDSGQFVTFAGTVRRDDADVLELRKTYSVEPRSPHLKIQIEIDNVSDEDHIVSVTQSGPIGLKMEDPRWDYRAVIQGVLDAGGQIVLGDENPKRDDVFESQEDQSLHTMKLRVGPDEHAVWTAIGNKYFTVIVVPLSGDPEARYCARATKVEARTRLNDASGEDDLTFDMALDSIASRRPLGAGQTASLAFEVYCGPKSRDALDEAGLSRAYIVVTHADQRACTFQFIGVALRWLLVNLHRVFGNYGIAIIFLVVIVKLILHPISKRGQTHMMRSQRKMAQVKPKLDALQKQHKNDKQRYQQEQMKLFREEKINPAGTIFGCLPMLLQMPIWIALWTTLNTNVDMRHEPFFWWIRDLSSPDALIPGLGPYNIPLLGAMIGPITSFNLLPIIMAATMYIQQKFTQKLTKPKDAPKPALDAEGRPVIDQQAQMQKMMGFMTVFMGLIFYNFPSGLSLYILTSNMLGMLEQWQIRKHIREKEERGEFDGKSVAVPKSPGLEKPPGPKKPGFLERLEKKAEQVRVEQSGRPARREKRRKKQRY